MAVSSSSPPSLPLNTMVHMLTIKLTSSNYLLWRNQFVPLLASQELFGYLDDTAQFTLSSLTEESMSEVLGFRHSHEAWHALEVSFSHRSKTRELQLKDELQLMHRGSQSIAEFSRTFKGLCDQLAAIGRPIDDTDKVHSLSHEIFERSVSHSYSNSAYFVQQTSKVAGHKQVKHRSSASPIPFANSKSSSNSSVRCQLCNKEGHLAKRCWNFLKLKKKQSAKPC
ncbi:hypothetical protein CK203_001737 [Vitis vinifera]|uniref:CCHC-type domain-containing protein n=1 Tax=Vitis vinifera TaxID=29760 RepID=A0A438KJB4_VITVI|nr:hypothetical protein CK203_001737 [Vitis vinifera]